MDKNGEVNAKIYDFIIKPLEAYPQAQGLIIRRGFPNRKYTVVPFADIEALNEKEARLKVEFAKLKFEENHDDRQELTLRRDILDQQVVDTHNHKVIRINDIHLLFVNHSLMVAHVDISLRGLFRRLGVEKLVDFLIRLINKNAKYLKTEYLIPWKYIQPLSINPASMTIKVNVPQKQFNAIPAADLGEIFLEVSSKNQIALFRSVDIITRARIFTHIDFKTQKLMIEELPDKEIAELLNNIPSDEATDFLEKLPKSRVGQLLGLMENKYAKKLSELLGYSNDSAGGLMTAEYIACLKNITVEAALKQIKERSFKVEPAQFVYVLDEESRLIGATNFRRLILAGPQEQLMNIIFPKTYFVNLESGVKEVAYLMEKYKYYTIPVVDNNNVLKGIITVDDILSQLITIAWRRLKKIKVLPKQ
ncbi:MAG: CBS domain-containing protein [Candidatus Omnitrophota bacterium]|nr:CBS domain-containing protein [Candidatus Omnitrophota bacterium]